MPPTQHKTTLMKMYKTLYRTFGPQHWWPGDSPFEIAVGAILTQNTNWNNVERAIQNIKKRNSLDPAKLLAMQDTQLSTLIRPAGYFNVKTRRLKSFLGFLGNHYGGSMSRMKKGDYHALRQELLSVNGIGPETADSIMLYALDKPVFVVDAYTKRILLRHKLISPEAAYHDIQDFFHTNLRGNAELFNEYHALLVKAGKDFCKPKPSCEECPLQTI